MHRSISFVIQSCLLVGILFYNVDYLRDRFHFLRSTRALVGKIERRNARAAQLAFQRPANTDKNPP